MCVCVCVCVCRLAQIYNFLFVLVPNPIFWNCFQFFFWVFSDIKINALIALAECCKQKFITLGQNNMHQSAGNVYIRVCLTLIGIDCLPDSSSALHHLIRRIVYISGMVECTFCLYLSAKLLALV